MVRLVEKRAEVGLRGKQFRRLRDERLEQDDTGGKIRRHDDPDAGVGDRFSQRRLVLRPAGGPDDETDPAFGEDQRVGGH